MDKQAQAEIEEIKRLREIREIKRLRAEKQQDSGSWTGALTSGPIVEVPVLSPLARKAGNVVTAAGAKLFGDERSFGDIYDQLGQKQEVEQAQFAQKHPVANVAKNIAGGMLIPNPAGIGATAAGVAAKTGLQATGLGARALAGGANAAARVGTGSVTSYIDALSRGMSQEEAAEAAKTAATVGGAFEAVIPAAKGAAKFTSKYVFGVPQELAQRYLGRRPQINAASEERTVNDITDAARSLQEPAEQAEKNLAQARMAESEAWGAQRERASGLVRDAQRESDYLASEAAGAARRLRDELASTKPPEEMVPVVSDAVKDLRGKISQQSTKAFEALPADARINMAPHKASFTMRMQRFLTENGTQPPPGTRAASDLSKMQAWRDWMDNLGSEWSAADVKQVIQFLDEEAQQAYAARASGGYVSIADRELIAFRRELNNTLLEIPGYREAMEPFKPMMQIMERAEDRLMSPESTRATLQRVGQGKSPEDATMLAGLGEQTGRDLVGPLDAYSNAQNTLRSREAMHQATQGLPESVAAREAAAKVDEMSLTARSRDYLTGLRQNMPEAAALREAQAAQQAAAERAYPVRNVDTSRAQSDIRTMMSERRPQMGVRERLEYLGKETGNDFLQAADDLSVQNAMNRGFTNGSRNVNLASFSLGNAVGFLSKALFGGAGEQGQRLGGAIGAMIGGAADISGPKTVKFFLDMSQTPAFKTYVPMLQQAMRRGANAFSVTAYALGNRDPRFADFLRQQAMQE